MAISKTILLPSGWEKRIFILLLWILCVQSGHAQLFIAKLVPDQPFNSKNYIGGMKVIAKTDGSGFYVSTFTTEMDKWDFAPQLSANGVELYDVSREGNVVGYYKYDFFPVDTTDLTLRSLYQSQEGTLLISPEPEVIDFITPIEEVIFTEVKTDTTQYWQETQRNRFTLRSRIDLSTSEVRIDTLVDFLDKISPPDSSGCYPYSTLYTHRIGRWCSDTASSVDVGEVVGGMWHDTIIGISIYSSGMYVKRYDLEGRQLGEEFKVHDDTIDGWEINYQPFYFDFFPNSTFLILFDAYKGVARKRGFVLLNSDFDTLFVLDLPFLSSGPFLCKAQLTPQGTYLVSGSVFTFGLDHIFLFEVTREGKLLWSKVFPYYFDWPANVVYDVLVEEDALYLLISNVLDNRLEQSAWRLWLVKLTRTGEIKDIAIHTSLESATTLTVAPNPARDIFTIYSQAPSRGDLHYSVCDLQGRPLLSGRVGTSQSISVDSNRVFSVDLSAYPPGVYILTTTYSDHSSAVTKLIRVE